MLTVSVCLKDEMKRQSREEKENFIREIQAFNNDFNLLSNRKSLSKSQTQSEIQELEKEISTLNQGTKEPFEIVLLSNESHVTIKTHLQDLELVE